MEQCNPEPQDALLSLIFICLWLHPCGFSLVSKCSRGPRTGFSISFLQDNVDTGDQLNSTSLRIMPGFPCLNLGDHNEIFPDLPRTQCFSPKQQARSMTFANIHGSRAASVALFADPLSVHLQSGSIAPCRSTAPLVFTGLTAVVSLSHCVCHSCDLPFRSECHFRHLSQPYGPEQWCSREICIGGRCISVLSMALPCSCASYLSGLCTAL